jgi:hypothetical protein
MAALVEQAANTMGRSFHMLFSFISLETRFLERTVHAGTKGSAFSESAA